MRPALARGEFISAARARGGASRPGYRRGGPAVPILDAMTVETGIPTADGYYECGACGRRYKSTTIPDKCAVCGAASGGRPRRAVARDIEPLTDKFRLAVRRAKGNFLE
jgi:hypothetical protein